MPATTESDLPNGRERRRWSRYDMTGPLAAVLVADGRRIACRIENVSLTGAKLRVAGALPPSPLVRLVFGRLTGTGGRRVWSSPESIGVTFGFTEDSVDLAMACLRRAAGSNRAESA